MMIGMEKAKAVLKVLQQKPISYYPVHAKIMGGVAGGVVLSQIMFRYSIGQLEILDKELRAMTGVSDRELREAKKTLKSLPFVGVHLVGVPATTRYEIDEEKYIETLVAVQTSLYDGVQTGSYDGVQTGSYDGVQTINREISEEISEEILTPRFSQTPESDRTGDSDSGRVGKGRQGQGIGQVGGSLPFNHPLNQNPELVARARDIDKAMPEPTVPAFGVEELVALYNEMKPEECPEVIKLSAARKKTYKAYLKQFPDESFWLSVFYRLAESRFLLGYHTSPSHPNFKASLDWLCQKGGKDGVENCVKVWEGKYSDIFPAQTNGAGNPSEWYSDAPGNSPLSRNPD